ncbi:hypothetical protein Q8F55_001569 [Vanrija albida]|uniref:Uncharacterized protein n=1 Tax=Vanrija albida TaxID=181172 RepID=A0ABR3QGF4_9TREE
MPLTIAEYARALWLNTHEREDLSHQLTAAEALAAEPDLSETAQSIALMIAETLRRQGEDNAREGAQLAALWEIETNGGEW